MSAEVDLVKQARKWARTWTWIALFGILAPPVVLSLTTLVFLIGLKPFLFLFAAFLVVAIVGFLLGPVSVAWSFYIALTEVILGLSEDHRYLLCCSDKNRAEAEFGSYVPFLMFPAGIASCLLLVRLIIWNSLTVRQMLLTVAISIGVAQAVLWIYQWQEVIVRCSSVWCHI
ncbi:hypothetical protein [Candidatus Phyllobacterium onerii]|uniref:hypothetical protein n=1 Tax=Candidatus Phyllobacterium onerii TaxID=3020828 RepID=UPI00232D5657|nr:hypothetical protein [Phyllobacterium sp. IY22]